MWGWAHKYKDTQGTNSGSRLLHHSTLWTSWSSSLGYSQKHEEKGTFFKYLKDIYTPAQCEVKVHRGVGAQLCFRPMKRQYHLNFSDGLIDTIQTRLLNTKTKLCKHLHICIHRCYSPELTHRGIRLYRYHRKQVHILDDQYQHKLS